MPQALSQPLGDPALFASCRATVQGDSGLACSRIERETDQLTLSTFCVTVGVAALDVSVSFSFLQLLFCVLNTLSVHLCPFFAGKA